MDGATHTDNYDAELGPESGFDDFLQTFLPPDARKRPSEEDSENTPDEQTNDEPTKTQPEDDESPSEGDEEKDGEEKDADAEDGEGKEPDKKFADDGVFVKIAVDGKEHVVAVKDLQRLYGQEAALTQKGQKVADERKAVEQEVTRNKVVTDALLQRAMSRFEPYSKVDFNLAAQQLSADEYTALRNEAQAAYQDVVFLKEHADAYAQHVQNQHKASLQERAAATLKELGDADKGIPGWNEVMYQDMVKFATSKYGIPGEVINNIVDPWAFRLLHDAMAFNKAKDVDGNVKVTKVNKTPKKIVKSSQQSAPARAHKDGKALQKLQQTGSVDDATNAFLESLADQD